MESALFICTTKISTLSMRQSSPITNDKFATIFMKLLSMQPPENKKEKLGLRAWLKFVASNHHVYRIIWESLFVEPELFRNYYIKFGNAYADALKRDNILEGEDIDLKTVAFMLMGVSNFIGLHTLFDGKYDDETIDKICDDAIKVLDKGLF